MTPTALQAFYENHPRMVSSPFGGVDGINRTLFLDTLRALDISLEGKRVIDVGCGRGFAGELVRECGGQYTGLDFVCSRKGFPLVLSDAASLPFGDASFDLALCIDASEHFPEPLRAAQELYRVLKPGGVFFLSAPQYGNVAGVVKRVCEGLGWCPKNAWAPFGRWEMQECEQPLTIRTVRSLYGNAGFVNFHYIAHAPEVGLGLFPWMDHPRMPDAVRFRLQRLFRETGPAISRVWPGASLHLFWRMEKRV